jgi:signal transduction histidine kinase/CheY-like chemotaxis protein
MEVRGQTDTVIRRSSRIVRRYFLVFATLIGGVLSTSFLIEMAFRYQEAMQQLDIVHQQMAELAALRIRNYVESVAQSVRLAAQPGQVNEPYVTKEYISTLHDLRKNVPAIREIVALDLGGREVLRESRIGPSLPQPDARHSSAPYFLVARAGETYFGPVTFPVDAFEPRILIAVPMEPFQGKVVGVLAVEVNVKYVWDVVQEIHAGEAGYAYVVSDTGALVAHPDFHLVLQRKDLSNLPQFSDSRTVKSQEGSTRIYKNLSNQAVVASHMAIPRLGWTVFVEQPLVEAYRPLLASLARTAGILLILCILAVTAAVLLGRRVVGPIEVLRRGATRLEAGDLQARLVLNTGDEFEELANDFNRMAGQLEESYVMLERRVEERTRQLELANLAKSRFLASASHDLRQPLHALGLFAGQLNSGVNPHERRRLIERIQASVADMNKLFNALLDISRLDAGGLTPDVTEFPVSNLLKKIESTFAELANQKGLRLHIIPTDAWARSDPILLERILLNLVSNAVRYTSSGGVLVGCRKRGRRLRIEVSDTGPGIAEDQRQNIFGEFYRLEAPNQDRCGGLGLGLAIVERLCRLLDQPIELTSTVGRGSRFAVLAELVPLQLEFAKPPVPTLPHIDAANGKLVVIIDDDLPALEGMGGLLRSWGCCIVTGTSLEAALVGLADHREIPDLIISDYRLADGKTGIDAIERLRIKYGNPLPAFLISGDTDSETRKDVRAQGYQLIQKPVEPMTVRAVLNQILLKAETRARRGHNELRIVSNAALST